MPRNELITDKAVKITAWLQEQCVKAYLDVMQGLKVGQSEADVAQTIRNDLLGKGITDYWYDIPIMVFFGPERFMMMVEKDYVLKSPSTDVLLQPGHIIFIDMHPTHESGRWGDFSASGIYLPRNDQSEAIDFLQTMQQIHNAAIATVTSQTTGKDLTTWFDVSLKKQGVQPVDVRNNYGHTMGSGAKTDHQRSFIDETHTQPMAGNIYAVEPGGYLMSNKMYVARFEDCIHVPESGPAVILGRNNDLPVLFGQ